MARLFKSITASSARKRPKKGPKKVRSLAETAATDAAVVWWGGSPAAQMSPSEAGAAYAEGKEAKLKALGGQFGAPQRRATSHAASRCGGSAGVRRARAGAGRARVAGKFHGLSSLGNLVVFGCAIAHGWWAVGQRLL